MADVTERGQLFLIGGLSLAVVLVVLAVTLNSAIYTENLATRGSETANSDAVMQAREDAVRGVGGVMEHTIENESSYSEQDAAVNSGVADWHDLGRRYASQNGRLIELRYQPGSYTEGTRISQTSDDDFRDNGGNDSWTVATDVPAVRQFRMNTSRSRLNSLLSDSFSVTFTPDSGDTYTVYVNQSAVGDETIVSVHRAGTLQGSCTDSGDDRTDIDVTGATVNGTYCPPLKFFGQLSSPYNITFTNGDDVEGTYDLTVQKSYSNVDDGPYGADGPTKQHALYSTTVHFYFESNRFVYETDLRVAPGEQDA